MLLQLRFAFVLVHEDGTPPSEEAFEKVERYRRVFEAVYAPAAGGRAKFLEERTLLARFPERDTRSDGLLSFVVDLLKSAGARI